MKGEDLTLTPNTFMSKWQPLKREMEPSLISYILVRNKTLWSCITPYWACMLCLACQHFDFNSVLRFSDNLHVNSSCKLLFTNKGKGIWLLVSANVPWAGTCDKPLRSSVWEASIFVNPQNILVQIPKIHPSRSERRIWRCVQAA